MSGSVAAEERRRLLTLLRGNAVLWECLDLVYGSRGSAGSAPLVPPASFGYAIEPYTSTEAAIRTWPTTATAVGVRMTRGVPFVFAPFGLQDLFGLVVRANRVQITRAIYERKVARWTRCWPSLTVLPWAQAIGESTET